MVTLEQIADEVGQPTPSDGSQAARQWTQWMSSALLQIRIRFGDLDVLDPDVLDEVVRLAVAEKVKNPDGKSESVVSVDDASVTRKYSSSSGFVTILPQWWEWLSPGDDSSGAFTVTPVFEP